MPNTFRASVAPASAVRALSGSVLGNTEVRIENVVVKSERTVARFGVVHPRRIDVEVDGPTFHGCVADQEGQPAIARPLLKRDLSALALRACTSRAPAAAHFRTVSAMVFRVSDISWISPRRAQRGIPTDQQAPSKARCKTSKLWLSTATHFCISIATPSIEAQAYL